MMETDSGVLLAQASMTLYKDDQLFRLSSPEHHMECQCIQPERHQLEVAAAGTEPVGPTFQEYGVKLEVANRVAADLGASDVALDTFSSQTSTHLTVCEKYWSAQDSQGLMPSPGTLVGRGGPPRAVIPPAFALSLPLQPFSPLVLLPAFCRVYVMGNRQFSTWTGRC